MVSGQWSVVSGQWSVGLTACGFAPRASTSCSFQYQPAVHLLEIFFFRNHFVQGDVGGDAGFEQLPCAPVIGDIDLGVIARLNREHLRRAPA